MLSTDFSRWLTISGFERRATPVVGQGVVYRLANGSGHVVLSQEAWQELGSRLAAELKPIRRKSRWASILLFPGILLFAMTIGQMLPFAGIIVLAGILLGPTAIYLWQSRRIRRVANDLETDLMRLPRVGPPRVPRRLVPRWLEIAASLGAAPTLVFELWGTLFPGAFRNTPLSGTHLDWKGALASLLLLTVFLIRWRNNVLELLRLRDEPTAAEVAMRRSREAQSRDGFGRRQPRSTWDSRGR